jgi:hypothetical protein
MAPRKSNKMPGYARRMRVRANRAAKGGGGGTPAKGVK